MKNFVTPFKVGLVVLAGIVATIYMISRVSQDFSKGEGTYLVHATFDDVTGLSEKSQIRVAGIVVGEVASIELVGSRARISMKITDRVGLYEGIFQPDVLDETQRYKHGATISKKLSSLLGDYYLELTPGVETAGNKLIGGGGTIHNVIQSGGTEAIFKELEKITKDVSNITGALSDTLGGEIGRERIEGILRDVQDTTQALRTVMTEKTPVVDRIIDNVDQITAESRMTIVDTRRDLRLAMGDIRDVIQGLKVTLNHTGQRIELSLDKVDEGLDRGLAAVESAERSVKNVEELTQHINEGRGTAGRILKDDTLADEAEGLVTDSRLLVTDTRTLIKNVDETVAQLDDVLGTIGRLEIEVDWRNDFLWNTEAFKNIVAFKLKPSPNKWYQIEVVHDPRGSSKTVRRVSDSSTAQPTYEEVTETTSDFKFSVQYAGRYPLFPEYFEFAGRFGVIENTGGIGANLYFLDDDIELITDLYDFGFSENPRWRIIGLLHADLFIPIDWMQYVYLSGGVDDMLNGGTRDYFFGGGLSFTDQDLKGVLPFAPSP